MHLDATSRMTLIDDLLFVWRYCDRTAHVAQKQPRLAAKDRNRVQTELARATLFLTCQVDTVTVVREDWVSILKRNRRQYFYLTAGFNIFKPDGILVAIRS